MRGGVNREKDGRGSGAIPHTKLFSTNSKRGIFSLNEKLENEGDRKRTMMRGEKKSGIKEKESEDIFGVLK